MPSTPTLSFSDEIGDFSRVTGPPDFDRMYFNLYSVAREDGFLVLGGAVYPQAGVIDGFVCAVLGNEQRNLRFSDHLSDSRQGVAGPLTWKMIEPGRRWQLRLDPTPIGIEFDVIWEAVAPAYEINRYEVDDEFGSSSHAHYFQSGRYEGHLAVDGRDVELATWRGQRDRSRGHRRVRDSLGMHQWVQIQFERHSVGFLYNEDRDGRPTHCDGVVEHADGTVQRIVGVRHDLEFDETLELVGGRLKIELEGGQRRSFEVEGTGRGMYMSGAGYGGLHGSRMGLQHMASERWVLGGPFNARTLDFSIVDGLCRFYEGTSSTMGVFEYGLTRSPSYRYSPTLVHGDDQK